MILLLLIISAGLAVHQTAIFFRYFSLSQIIVPPPNLWAGGKGLRSGLSEEEVIFVFGKWDSEWQHEDHEAILKAYPDDIAIYSRYLGDGYLPKNFRDTVERLDPDNGWFDELEAAKIADDAREPTERRDDRLQYDEKKLSEVMELLHRSAAKPRSESYYRKLIERGTQIIPTGDDVQSRRRHYANGALELSEGSSTYSSWRAISAYAATLQSPDDLENFRKLVHTSNILMERRMASARNTIDLLVLASAMDVTRAEFSKAAERLGLPDEAKIYEEGAAMFRELRDNWKKREKVRDRKNILQKRMPGHLDGGGNFVDQFLKKPLDLHDLQPGVNAEHAHMASRFSLQGFYLFGVISLGVAVLIFRGRHSVQVIWKPVIFGSLLPFAIFFALRQWTSLGELEEGPG